ncbi:MAG: phosphoribosylanthranilate isomerase [Paracoccaceae bacterium]
MSNPVRVKICGVTSQQLMRDVGNAGAQYAGLVFFEKSPRNLSLDKARSIALEAPTGLAKVALVVNPSDRFLDSLTTTVPLDMIQLHGSETPQRVSEIKQKTGLPVMKAIGVAEQDDLKKLDVYATVADQLMVDAKPAKDAILPGGNGSAFDWSLLQGRRWTGPWMLAGGLNPENVAQAIAITGAQQIDVSSGVEIRPGEKDKQKINAFVRAAHTHSLAAT